MLADSALDEARAAEKELAAGRVRGPLHGVPIGVKDLCDVAGVPTTSASRVLDPKPAARDSGVVRKLREAGAVIVGKLHQTEFALSGYHPSLPVPVNPWDPSRFAGVSSSGSGVAAAAGLAFATIGTDTGGSIRFPAAACGVVGLKPTRGRVSRAGAFPLGGSLDHIGPLARSVADVAAVLDAIAGADPDDPTALREPSPGCVAALGRGARGVRIGVDVAYATDGVQPEVADAFHRDLQRLEAVGANVVVAIRVPPVDEVLAAWPVLCAAEAVVHHRGLYPERAGSYGPTFRTFLAYGSALSGAEVADAWLARELWNARFAGRARAGRPARVPVDAGPAAAAVSARAARGVLARHHAADPLHCAVRLQRLPDALAAERIHAGRAAALAPARRQAARGGDALQCRAGVRGRGRDRRDAGRRTPSPHARRTDKVPIRGFNASRAPKVPSSGWRARHSSAVGHRAGSAAPR